MYPGWHAQTSGLTHTPPWAQGGSQVGVSHSSPAHPDLEWGVSIVIRDYYHPDLQTQGYGGVTEQWPPLWQLQCGGPGKQKLWAQQSKTCSYLPKLQNKIIQIRLFVKVRICWISLKWSLSKFCIVTKCGRSSVPVWLFVMLPSITFLIYLKLLMPLLEQVYHSLLLLLYFVSFQYWEIRIIEQNICIVPPIIVRK